MLTLLAAAATEAGVITPDLQTLLDDAAPADKLAVIVRFRTQAPLALNAERSRAELVRRVKGRTISPAIRGWLQKKGVREITPLWIINGAAVSVPALFIAELARLPGVEQVNPDTQLTVPEIRYDAQVQPQWNIDVTGAPTLWQLGYTGQNTVVANMDTGVDPDHPDLVGKWRGGGNSWFDPYGVYAAPVDPLGHGTATMGIIVAGDNSGQAIGMAPGAQWIAVKIFNDNGTASISAVHLGFQWLLDPDGDPATDDAPDVVNNSWAFSGAVNQCVTEFSNDIALLETAGTVVVFSAGNTGPRPVTSVSPANNPETLGVGAVSDTLDIADFSARGPSACDGDIFPAMVAPGVNVRTADLSYGGIATDPYINVSGTSISVPHVAGAVALLRSALGPVGTAQLESALRESAVDSGNAGPDNDYGWGMLDVAEAYARLLPAFDSDGDGIADARDNCTDVANADQRDSDGDNYGNLCDPDLNNDGIVNFEDLAAFRPVFLATDGDADFNGDGLVNFADLAIFRSHFLKAPGPSGLIP